MLLHQQFAAGVRQLIGIRVEFKFKISHPWCKHLIQKNLSGKNERNFKVLSIMGGARGAP